MDNLASSASVFTAAFIHHLDLSFISFGPKSDEGHLQSEERRRWAAVNSVFFCYLLPSTVLIIAPPHSVACLLRPTTKLLCQWPKLLKPAAIDRLPSWMTGATGPFGYGCGKACEFICAYFLLSLKAGNKFIWNPPEAFRPGPMPGMGAVLLVLALSAAVNLVLSLWSRHARSRGNHEGVNAMVDGSAGRKIGVADHLRLAAFALGNAICEECVSRGLFYHEFKASCNLSKSSANLAQAAAFGVWHYNGIPSGYLGVGLTFIYGCIMGILLDYGSGLILPILAHAIADYFIFAVIARRGLVESRAADKNRKHT